MRRVTDVEGRCVRRRDGAAEIPSAQLRGYDQGVAGLQVACGLRAGQRALLRAAPPEHDARAAGHLAAPVAVTRASALEVA